VAGKLTGKRLDDLDDLRRWLAMLVAPGASLGGARPKANFTAADGSLGIAKFPASDDERDIGAWEGVAHAMAQAAGIDVPQARVLAFGRHHHTFCVRRFDRQGGKRRFYASAMALLRKDRSEGSSYLELAEFIRQQGAPGFIAQDLEQMFRRVAFNVAIGNRDDHLRNHGFIFGGRGWRLSPAFDLNPNVDRGEHVLNIDDADNRPDLRTVLSTAEFYGLTARRGHAVIEAVLNAVRGWRQPARQAGISRADVELTSVAFNCAR
jgi:serine/threonine-protein kinase HipA